MSRLVVADDLTGAGDAALQFVERGTPALVWLDWARPVDDSGAATVVVDLDSRALAPDAAYRRMRDFLDHQPAAARRSLIMKMDSTLRGNPGPELRAVLEALPARVAVVCPAYPQQGRTVRDGIVSVDGTPVDRTDFARDLGSPVGDARVAAHLDRPSTSVALATVRAGAAALGRAVARARGDGTRIVICDAESDADLRAIAGLAAVRDDVLWVGSAGLLAMLGPAPAGPPSRRPEPPAACGPVVFLVGSVSAMTRRQVADYAAHGGTTVRLEPAALLRGDAASATALAAAAAALASGHDVVVALAGDRARVDAAVLRERFIAATAALVRPGATVVLSGGDIARAFCEAHRIRGAMVLAEAAPGIPLARALGADLFLITKAGGFGRPQSYRDIVAALSAKVAT